MSLQIQTSNGQRVYVDLDGFDRIREHSPQKLNHRVNQDIEQHILELAPKGREALSDRISELDREWDIDRATMVVFAAAAATVATLAATRSKKWLGLFGLQLPWLVYHASSGWCPPVSLLRRLGFRSAKEIDAEKYALKSLRGDFRMHDTAKPG